MSRYESNLTLDEAAQRLDDAQRILLTTHAKPDGDAFGSVVALAAALEQQGKHVSAWFSPPVPLPFKSFRGAELVNEYRSGADIGDCDLAVILDTGAWSQVAPMRAVLEPLLDRTMLVDHHLRGDVPAAWRLIDSTAAATAEMVAQLLTRVSADDDLFTPTVCDALFVGIASDTGWFRFSNTTARTHELAAQLLRRGVDHADLYQRTEQVERLPKLSLITRALTSLQLLADDSAALMVLRAADFAQTGARLEETERIVDLPQVVEQVKVVVLVTEPPASPDEAGGVASQPIRVSFRSKPGPNAVDVSDLAATFGGGGHARAAGAKINAPLDDVLQRIGQALECR